MRLAIVRRRYAQFGGAERSIEGIANDLVREGIDACIVSESWSGQHGFKQISVPSRGVTRRGRLANFQREVAAIVAANKFDLVQSHERLLTADIFRAGDGVHAAWLARLAAERGPWLSLMRRLNSMHRLVLATERQMARDTSMLFVANSALVAGEIAGWLGVPQTRIRTIENGVDTKSFYPPSADQRAAARRRFNLDAGSPVVAFVGSGFERKGAFQLTEALALPQCRHTHALIAGRDRKADSLRRRVAALGLSDRVQLLGGVTDPLGVYHAADVFALPSLYDSMGNSALEALACGLPILVTADTGVAGYAQQAGAGVVVTRAAEAIAAGIFTILDNHARMADAAITLARSFDLSVATARWLALYRELA